MDGWSLVEDGTFDISRAKALEGLMAQGSGYLHVRGSLEEHFSDVPQNVSYLRRPANVTAEKFPTMMVKWGTFVPGIYGAHPLMGKEMANLPYFLGLAPAVDGERLDLQTSKVENYRRELNFHSAVLTRTLTWMTASGATVEVQFERFVSAARPHLCVQRMTVTSDRAAQLTVRAGIDSDVRTSGYDHFTQVGFSREAPDRIRCDVRLDTGDEVSELSQLSLPSAVWTYHETSRTADLETTLALEAGVPLTVEKRTAVTTSFDATREDLTSLLADDVDYDKLFQENAAVWQGRWQNSDVLVEGDERSQLALRLSIYHLLRSHTNDSRVAIDPKAYAGDAYRGLYFWDTEMYLLPFFLYTDPERGKMLTDFRIGTLDGAKANAKEYGYEGARYPWEGDIDGIDQCPAWQYRDHEVHVTADVVYGFIHYAHVAKDPEYLSEAARDVIRETATYWLDRADWRDGDDYPSILGVMGPDEYTPITSNNAYTNRLVSLALNCAARVADGDLREEYAKVARALPILRRADGLVLQCEEFEQLADIHFDDFWHNKAKPFAAQVSQERIYRSKCMKQADVLLLMMLFPQEFTDDEVQQAWDYYLPYTTHDSSLSPGVHAVVALRLGLMEQAMAFWKQSAEIDLNDGAEEGIHIAAAGMNWQIAVFGFGGVQSAMNVDQLTLAPVLPEGWTRLAFPLNWKGQRVFIDVQGGEVSIMNLSDEPLTLALYGQVFTVDGHEALVAER